MKRAKAVRTAARAPREEPRPDPYAKLGRMMERQGATRLEDAFVQMARQLADSSEEGTLQFTVADKGDVPPSVIHVGSKAARVTRGGAESPRFEVIAEAAALEEVLSGARSPISAMAAGQMRVRGDLDFGKHVYRKLAADRGLIGPCEPGEAVT